MDTERIVFLTAGINLVIAIINLQITFKNKKDTTPKE
jgi:hypothetical protein